MRNTLRLIVAVSLILAVTGVTTTRASVSGILTYSSSFTNPLPFPVSGLSVSIGLSHSISGTATITGPGGDVIATIGMSGGSVTLDEVGTYSVSENYRIELTGTPPELYGSPETMTDEASDSWSFDNSVSGSTGVFTVSSSFSVSTGEVEGSISVSASESGIDVEITGSVAPGETVSASIEGEWGVDTSMSIEATPASGTIEVNTNLTEATFSLSGPADYSGSGMSWMATDVSLGTYTITYGDVFGYKTPSSETQILTSGATIGFTGTYVISVPGTGTIEVHTNLDGAAFSLSGPASYNGSGKSWVTTEVAVGAYSITYHEVPGYQTPSSATHVLFEGGVISFSGTYNLTPRPSWDVNKDGVVDLLDIKAVGSGLGKTPAPAELDVNGDGFISVLDIILVSVHFGEEYDQ